MQRLILRPGEQVFRQNDDARLVGQQIRGVSKITHLRWDGVLQVLAFVDAGDLIGFAAEHRRTNAVEAVSNVEVDVIDRAVLEALAGEYVEIADAIRLRLYCELRRYEERMRSVGQKSAREKLAAFLLERARDLPSDIIRLDMSQTDVADYLGLVPETVSRTMSWLRVRGLIERSLPQNLIRINRAGLSALVDGHAPGDTGQHEAPTAAQQQRCCS